MKKLFLFICRKVFLGVCAAAIVVLAAINLNLVRNSEDLANLSLANIVSLARDENGQRPYCSTDSKVVYNDGTVKCVDYYYDSGNS